MKTLSFLVLAIFLSPPANTQIISDMIKAVATDRASSEQFGYSVSISNNYAVVGAYNERLNYMDELFSSVYFFERSENGNWSQVKKIMAPNQKNGDSFGRSVYISGNYAIIGAASEIEDVNGENPIPWAGSAYIFERDESGIWNQVQKIVPSDRSDKRFGASVSISGNYAIIGAPGETISPPPQPNTIYSAGSAYIFEREESGIWKEVKKLVAIDDRSDFDGFGYSVSISNNYAIVGAESEDEDASGLNTVDAAGSAYIFERDENEVWNESQKIVSSERDVDDWFGVSVSIDGNHAIVGSHSDESPLFNAGSVFVFERDESGIWKQVQKIVASDGNKSDMFGISVSISGNNIIVGSIFEDEDSVGANYKSDAGSAYIFTKDVNGLWNQIQKVVAFDREANDAFGSSVSISGNNIIVGAPSEDDDVSGYNTRYSAGSIYLSNSIATSIYLPDFTPLIVLYPNPLIDYSIIKLSNGNQLKKIEIIDIYGRIVFARTIDKVRSNSFRIQRENLLSGIYFIRVYSSDINTEKILP